MLLWLQSADRIALEQRYDRALWSPLPRLNEIISSHCAVMLKTFSHMC
jgi:hypothetical protein